jgi:hypothetical protein
MTLPAQRSDTCPILATHLVAGIGILSAPEQNRAAIV